MDVDADIVKQIIDGCTIKAESSKEWNSFQKLDNYSSVNSLLIDRVSKSLTTLLSYKVSKEAYQRYSVRLHIIDTLRDWCRLKGNLANLPTFQDSEQSYNFLLNLIKKNVTEKTLSNCDNPDDLIQVAEILMNAEKKDRSFIKGFIKVIERMISLTQSDKSKKFLEYIISKTDVLKLNFSFVEKIYSAQKIIFIEKPIADCFISYCSDQSKLEKFNELESFWEKVSQSPTLFYIVSKQLKEFFLTTEYSKLSQDFIKKILNEIQLNCDKKNKDIVNLYPCCLRHCAILMRIKPSDHSEKSRNHTVKSLREIFMKNWCDTLILVSHFPEWLPDYLKFFEILDETSQKSVQTIITIDDDDDDDDDESME